MTYQPRNPNGQAVMANSEPVVIASDQTAIPVTLPTGANVIGSIAQITTGVTPGTGLTNLGKAMGGTSPLSGDVGVLAMAVNSTSLQYQPIFVDGSGRLITTISTLIPGTAATNLGKAEDAVHTSGDTGVFILGVAASSATVYSASGDYTPFSVDTAGRLRVHGAAAQDAAVGGDVLTIGGRASYAEPTAMSADGDAIFSWLDRRGRTIVANKCATSSVTSVAAATSSTQLMAATVNRIGATVYNDSTSVLYLNLGNTASSTSFTIKLQPEDYYEVPFGYTGAILGIWTTATGSARLTELS
jgi:hypothetical protein